MTWFPRALAALGAFALLGAGGARAETRKFKVKACGECHAAFSQKLAPLSHQHPGVKNDQCETCHVRHGVVPKLILKAEGNALCVSCHAPAQIGLDKAHVHSALKSGTCVQC